MSGAPSNGAPPDYTSGVSISISRRFQNGPSLVLGHLTLTARHSQPQIMLPSSSTDAAEHKRSSKAFKDSVGSLNAKPSTWVGHIGRYDTVHALRLIKPTPQLIPTATPLAVRQLTGLSSVRDNSAEQYSLTIKLHSYHLNEAGDLSVTIESMRGETIDAPAAVNALARRNHYRPTMLSLLLVPLFNEAGRDVHVGRFSGYANVNSCHRYPSQGSEFVFHYGARGEGTKTTAMETRAFGWVYASLAHGAITGFRLIGEMTLHPDAGFNDDGNGKVVQLDLLVPVLGRLPMSYARDVWETANIQKACLAGNLSMHRKAGGGIEIVYSAHASLVAKEVA